MDLQRVNTKHEQAQGVLFGCGAGRAAQGPAAVCTPVFAFALGAFLVVFMGD